MSPLSRKVTYTQILRIRLWTCLRDHHIFYHRLIMCTSPSPGSAQEVEAQALRTGCTLGKATLPRSRAQAVPGPRVHWLRHPTWGGWGCAMRGRCVHMHVYTHPCVHMCIQGQKSSYLRLWRQEALETATQRKSKEKSAWQRSLIKWHNKNVHLKFPRLLTAEFTSPQKPKNSRMLWCSFQKKRSEESKSPSAVSGCTGRRMWSAVASTAWPSGSEHRFTDQTRNGLGLCKQAVLLSVWNISL